MKESVVIIPTYNEIENIEAIIRAVLELPHPFDLLIVDDSSPDGTADVVKRLQGEYRDRLHLMERSGKMGLGTAYIAGFKWTLDRPYQYVFEMDADFSHNPKDLIRLYEAAVDGADVVIGSRYCSGVNVVNWPMGRVLMSYFASKYVRLITRMKTHDTTAGFVCYKRAVLEAIDMDRIRFKGYAFQVEMKYTAYCLGFKLKEVSIVFVNRIHGVSKMSSGIFTEGVIGVITMRVRRMFGLIGRKK